MRKHIFGVLAMRPTIFPLPKTGLKKELSFKSPSGLSAQVLSLCREKEKNQYFPKNTHV